MPFWVKNAAENYAPIKEAFKEGNKDVGALGQDATKPVLIIGSGPSLNDWEPYFKDWEGEIFCSSSHLAFFEAIGVKPTYCFIIDADPNMSYLVSQADTKDITLITHPNMDPVVRESWQGPIYYFRMNDPGDDWFGKFMPMMFNEFSEPQPEEGEHERDWGGSSGQYMGEKKTWSGIKCFVLNSGNVNNTMIALSQFMGPKRNIFLCGTDLGFPGGVTSPEGLRAWTERAEDMAKSAGEPWVEPKKYSEFHAEWKTWRYRFNGYKRTREGFEASPDPGIPSQRLIRQGHNGVKTDQVSCFYKYSTLILWGMDAPEIYTCSRGILDEIPYIAPQDVIACQGDVADSKKVAPREKYKIAQEYLRHRGIYIMKGLGKTTKRETTPEKFRRTKKFIIKYIMFVNKLPKWLQPKSHVPITLREAVTGILSAAMVKFPLKYWVWTFSPTETVRERLGYTAITNKHHVKGLAKALLVVKFYTGKVLRLW
jgi:hypothetical protein